MKPGDVALVYFPFSYREEEPFKKRPVVVVGCTQPGELGDHAVLVAQVTSNPDRVNNPGQGDVIVENWRAAGLDRISVVRARRLWTPEPRDFARDYLGSLDSDCFREVIQHVRLLVSP